MASLPLEPADEFLRKKLVHGLAERERRASEENAEVPSDRS
jgi:hypothetical protein